jgi:hypothetical protein
MLFLACRGVGRSFFNGGAGDAHYKLQSLCQLAYRVSGTPALAKGCHALGYERDVAVPCAPKTVLRFARMACRFFGMACHFFWMACLFRKRACRFLAMARRFERMACLFGAKARRFLALACRFGAKARLFLVMGCCFWAGGCREFSLACLLRRWVGLPCAGCGVFAASTQPGGERWRDLTRASDMTAGFDTMSRPRLRIP